MLKKHLIKIALSLLAGLLLVALIDELRVLVWAWFLVPLYTLGTVYGIESLAPKLWALLKTVADKLFMSMIMKSTLGCLIMLVFLPIALTVLLTIGWVSGIVCLITGLVEAFREEGGDLAARRSLHRQPKPSKSSDGKGYTWEYEPLGDGGSGDYAPLGDGDGASPSLPPEDYGYDYGAGAGSDYSYEGGSGSGDDGYGFGSYGDGF